jgi:hypothetical protein
MWRGGSGRRNGAAHMTPRGYRGLLQSLRLAVEKAACCVLREHYDDEMNWSTTHTECVESHDDGHDVAAESRAREAGLGLDSCDS